MDLQQVTKNVREVAACPPDHVIDVRTLPDLKDASGDPLFDPNDERYPAVVRHEAPSEKGPIASMIPVEQESWKSIVDGDNEAPDTIKEIIDLAHITHHELLRGN